MEHVSNDHKDCCNPPDNSCKLWWNRASHFEFDRKSVETKTTTWSEFPDWGKATEEKMLVSEESTNPKEQSCEIHCQESE